MKRLIFYNNWHNGDLHNSREFVKDIINKTRFDEYYYIHNRPPKILKDIPKIIYHFPNELCDNNKIIFTIENDTYINTWLGASGTINTGNVPPSLELFYIYFKFIYNKLSIEIEKEENYYIPQIDYNQYDIKNIKNYLKENKKRVLISNGKVWSYQSGDFNFNYIINKLSDDFENIDFILTDDTNKLNKNNILYTSDIIQCGEGDLNEISYLSTQCDIIIGKGSGPYTFSIVKENVFDPNKCFIFITHSYSDGSWNLKAPFKKIWINNYQEEYIYEIIRKKLNKMTGEKIEDIIKKTIKEALDKSKEVELPVDVIETDNIGEVIEKLAILHCRMWYLEDAIGMARTDNEIADLKKKIDICFKIKRPRYVEAINKMIDKAIKEGKNLEEDSVKLYKGFK